MNWRQFKTSPEGNKVAKVAKGEEPGGFATFATLIPPEGILKNQASDPSLHELIGKTMLEIDATGRPWNGWRQARHRFSGQPKGGKMSKYLARLKSANQSPRELTKPTKAPFVSNVSTEDEPFSEIATRHMGDCNNQFLHKNARARVGSG